MLHVMCYMLYIDYGVGDGVGVLVGEGVGVAVGVVVGVGVTVGLGVTVGAIAQDPMTYFPTQPDFIHSRVLQVYPIF